MSHSLRAHTILPIVEVGAFLGYVLHEAGRWALLPTTRYAYGVLHGMAMQPYPQDSDLNNGAHSVTGGRLSRAVPDGGGSISHTPLWYS